MSMSSDRAIKILTTHLEPNKLDMRDNDYRAIPFKDFMWLMMGRKVEPSYRKEIFDCDNYAVCFMADMYRIWANKSNGTEALLFGYIKGQVESGVHAWIWQIDDKGKINFIEPQTNQQGVSPLVTYFIEG